MNKTLDPDRTALIVVDVQNDFIAPGSPLESPAGREMVPTLQRVLTHAREHAMAVIYTTQVHRANGSDLGPHRDLHPVVDGRQPLLEGDRGTAIFPGLDPHPGDIVITKHRFSGFYGTDLEIVLRGLGVDTIVVSTENCVFATARDAMFRDYHTIVLSDATATFDHPDRGYGAMSADQVHRAALVILAGSTANVLTSDELINRTTGANRRSSPSPSPSTSLSS